MDEEQFKAAFFASWMVENPLAAFRDMVFGPNGVPWDTKPQNPTELKAMWVKRAVSEADDSWKLYADSRPAPEVSPEYARRWLDLNWPGLDDAIQDADHATLLKVAELVGYEPMEPRP